MIITTNGKLAIPYGSATPRAAALSAISDGYCDDLDLPGAPVAIIDCGEGRPLRMSCLVHPFTLPPVAQDLAHADTQVAFLKAHISGLCGMWNKPQSMFVAKYFLDVRSVVDELAPDLRVRMGDLAGLVEMGHWCFAAHMIMPRAHIVLGQQREEDYVTADFALWSGNRLTACFVSTDHTLIGIRKRAVEALSAAGAHVCHVPASEFLNPDWSLLDAIGVEAANFLDGVELAESPFHGRGLEAPIRVAG